MQRLMVFVSPAPTYYAVARQKLRNPGPNLDVSTF